MIHLYSNLTPNGLRAAIVLFESELAFETTRIDTHRGEQNTPLFAALNPARAIPVIVDDEGPGGERLVLPQSGAILYYVAEKCGRFIPTDDRRRATMHRWFMQVATDVTASSSWIFNHAKSMPVKEAKNADWLEQRLLDTLADTERWLGDHEYFAEEVTIADFLFFPNFAFRKDMLVGSGRFPNLLRWGESMSRREGVQLGMHIFDHPVPRAG